MANKQYNLYLDLSGSGMVPHIEIRRNDYDSNSFIVQVTQGGAPLDFTGMAPIFECLTPDGHYIRDDGSQYGTFSNVNAAQGTFEYTLVSEVFAALGQIDVAYFAFEQAVTGAENPTKRLSTGNFTFAVIADALTGTTAAADYMSDVTTLIQQINQLKTDYQTLNPANYVTQVDFTSQNNQVASQLADISQFKLLADVPNTVWESGQPIDYGYIRSLQIQHYGSFYRKVYKNTAFIIGCVGDSLTNGQDTVSSDARSVSSDTTHVSGEPTSSQTIASKTYPESLRDNLASLGLPATILNQGYSGDWVKEGCSRFPNTDNADVRLIMYGTNDSRQSATWVPADYRGDIIQYLQWYEQMIISSILQGAAVIILTPPKLPTANDADIESYAIALKSLGAKYAVPVIDTTEFTANYPSTIYCDTTHFNGLGYQVFAAKITALILGKGANNPLKVHNGTTLLTRPQIENVLYFGGATFSNSPNTQTPDEVSPSTGIIADWTGTGRGIAFSIYTEENDLLLLPFYYSSTSNLRITVDFNTVGPSNMNDLLVDYPVAFTEAAAKQITYNSWSNPQLKDLIKPTGDATQPVILRIVEKGWHVIVLDTTDPAAHVVFNSLHFMNYRSVKLSRDAVARTGYYAFSTHASWGLGTSVASTDIPVSTLLDALKLTLDPSLYWKSVPVKLKILITNDANSGTTDYMIEHIISLGDSGNTKGWNISSATTTPLVASPDSSRIKTCSGIVYNPSTGILTLNWAGNLTITAQCYITL